LNQFYDSELIKRIVEVEVVLPHYLDEQMIIYIMDKTNIAHLYECVERKDKFKPFKRYSNILVYKSSH